MFVLFGCGLLLLIWAGWQDGEAFFFFNLYVKPVESDATGRRMLPFSFLPVVFSFPCCGVLSRVLGLSTVQAEFLVSFLDFAFDKGRSHFRTHFSAVLIYCHY